MKITDLLTQVSERNIALALNGEQLAVRGKTQKLDADFLKLLREHKQALIDHLRQGNYFSPSTDVAADVVVPPNRITPDCRQIRPEMLPLITLTQAQIDQIVACVPGGIRNVADIYPLAPLQEGMVFHHMMTSEGDPFLMMRMMAFESRARIDRYMAALQAVVDRHDMLRTAILWENLPEPVQVVLHQAAVLVEEIAIDPIHGDVEQQLRIRFASQRRRIDIRNAPLIQGRIAYDPVAVRWLLVLMVHHAVGDRIGFGVMEEEIRAYDRGRTETLLQPQPFRNFIAHARLGMSIEKHEAFFRTMLGDLDEPTLPFGLQELHGEAQAVDVARLRLDDRLAQSLRAYARRLGVSVASVFHLAWAQVLACIAGKDDVVFGTILFGRMRVGEGADRIVGMCMNTLPLRVKLDGNDVAGGIRAVNSQLAYLMQHEHAPLALAQRCSNVAAPAPLFSSMVNFRHNFEDASTAGQADADFDGIVNLSSEERNSYPLTVTVDDLANGFGISIQVQQPVSAKRLCDYLTTTLTGLARALDTDASLPLRDVDVMPLSERTVLLEKWSAPLADTWTEPFELQADFERQAAATPSATAVVYQESSLSYEQLNTRANRLAHALRATGIGPDCLIGICVKRSLEMVVGLLGIIKAGAAYVPLDPSYPKDRIAMMLDNARPRMLLTQSDLVGSLPATGVPTICLDTAEAELACQPATNPAVIAASSNLAYVIYTSGSTGRPKGTLIHRGGMENLLRWYIEQFQLTASDRVLLFSSISFDLTQKNVFAPLLVGAQLHVPLEGYAPDLAPSYIAQHEITCLNCAPSAFYPLLPEGLIEHATSLRHVFLGGEPINTQLLHSAFSKANHTKVTIHNTYGPTEASDVVAFYSWDPKIMLEAIPIGRPVTNTRLYVLNAHQALTPIGVAGEICVGGIGVGYGYLDLPDLTAERFVDDPFVPGAKIYKTGDIGRWRDDGCLEFCGRKDFQVKLRGFRIELPEIDAKLADFPAIREAVTVVREDTPGDKRLVAYLTLNEGFERERQANEQSIQIERWREAYDTIYTQSDDLVAMDDFAGWTSSYNGLPLPAEDMHEWRDNTVARILALQPKRVLEIGCGSGLLLLRIAPHCVDYVGTDFSGATLAHLERRVADGGHANVRLYECTADNLSRVDIQDFDVIIINSVIQYFPSLDYLKQVVANARRYLVSGGQLFIGDVRNLALIGAYHASVQFHRKHCDDSLAELRTRIRRAIEIEKELLVHPTFFLGLLGADDRFSAVRIMPKVARCQNELTHFRYDVILHTTALSSRDDIPTWDWADSALKSRCLVERLTREAPAAVWVTGIRNPAVAKLASLYQRLREDQASVSTDIAQHIADSPADAEWGMTPAELAMLADDLGYAMEPSCADSDQYGRYAAFLHKTETGAPSYPSEAITATADVLCEADLSNRPLQLVTRHQVVDQIKTGLQRSLPEHMVPAHYVLLEKFPLNGNGKINRSALPLPELVRYEDSRYIAPRTEIEARLASVWKQLLKLENVSVLDDFFNLGGHSLLAVQMVNILKQQRIHLQIADVFRNRTIEALAACSMAYDGTVSENAAIPIRTGGSQQPLFLIHEGAGTLLYAFGLAPSIDADIPVYGLSVEPLAEAHLKTLEGMATRLVGLMRAVQPAGPYRIAGYCGGGMLAYEVASQLLGDDQDVQFLGLLNTAWIQPGNYLDNLMDIKSRLLAQTRPTVSTNPALRAAYDAIEARIGQIDMTELISMCRESELLPPTLSGLSALEVEQTIQRLHALVVAADAGGYVSQPLSIPVHYFWAKDDKTIAHPLRGWDEVLPSTQFCMIGVPGTHESMVQAPNVNELGKELSNAIMRAAKNTVEVPERDYAPLVTLQTGNPEVAPMICVPGAGATAASFIDLLNTLSEQQPVIGIQPRGMDGQLVPHSSVEAASASYLQALTASQRKAGVHLVGHSFGGWVVLEMAHRLHKDGQAPASITIIDSEPPTPQASIAEYSHVEAIGHLVKIFEQAAGRSLDIQETDLALLDEGEQRAILHSRLVEVGLLPKRSSCDSLRGVVRTFASCLRTSYVPPAVYPGTIQLVLANDPDLNAAENSIRKQRLADEWRQWANQVRLLQASGDHMTVLKAPNVHAVSAQMAPIWKGLHTEDILSLT